jgi:UDP-N-acetyl-D-mannosaminuronic acid transferase (WecB/TagA/CpsF family)
LLPQQHSTTTTMPSCINPHNKKPQYFLDVFFQGGAKMVNHHSKTNAYNTFKSLKATELNEGFFYYLMACIDVVLMSLSFP